jgi:hypothetical protein
MFKHILLFTNNFMEKKNLQDIIVFQMYEIMKIHMHFQLNYLIFWIFLIDL